VRKIHVAIKEPGKVPRSVWISPTKENLEKHVGGGLLFVIVCSDLTVICNRDQEINDAKYCAEIGGKQFFGKIIFAGLKDGGLADIPCSWQELKRAWPGLWNEQTD